MNTVVENTKSKEHTRAKNVIINSSSSTPLFPPSRKKSELFHIKCKRIPFNTLSHLEKKVVGNTQQMSLCN